MKVPLLLKKARSLRVARTKGLAFIAAFVQLVSIRELTSVRSLNLSLVDWLIVPARLY